MKELRCPACAPRFDCRSGHSHGRRWVCSGWRPSVVMAQPMFIGDYSTGNFSQWASVQNRGYNGPGVDYVPSYSATVVNDPVKGKAARFEVRSGDWPGFATGERSEVGSTQAKPGAPKG